MNDQRISDSDLAFDDFERSELGGNWAVYNGDVGIVNGRDLGILSKNAPMRGLGIVAWCAASFAADQFSEAVISPNVDEKAIVQVFVRRRTSDGHRYGFHYHPTGHWEIKYEGRSGRERQKGELVTLPSPPPAPGDTIRIEVLGDVIQALHNGVEVARVRVIESPLDDPGQPGMALNVGFGEDGSHWVERFPTPMVSRWTGGSLRRHSEEA